MTLQDRNCIQAIIAAIEQVIEYEHETYGRPADAHRLLIMRELLALMGRAETLLGEQKQ